MLEMKAGKTRAAAAASSQDDDDDDAPIITLASPKSAQGTSQPVSASACAVGRFILRLRARAQRHGPVRSAVATQLMHQGVCVQDGPLQQSIIPETPIDVCSATFQPSLAAQNSVRFPVCSLARLRDVERSPPQPCRPCGTQKRKRRMPM